MDVDHRGLNIRMTHICLHVVKRPRLDRQGAERVAQVVEHHRPVPVALGAEFHVKTSPRRAVRHAEDLLSCQGEAKRAAGPPSSIAHCSSFPSVLLTVRKIQL